MRRVMSVAAVATFAVMASAGLSRSAPQPVRRGDLDLSSPYIPPAPTKVTSVEKMAKSARLAAAEAKRARKAAKLRHLVAVGAMQAA